MDTIKDTSSAKIFPPVYPQKSYNKHPYLVIVRAPPSPMLEMPILFQFFLIQHWLKFIPLCL